MSKIGYILFSSFYGFLIILQGCVTPSQKKEEKKQNLLLIVVDDLNDYPQFFKGNDQSITPNIDKLASTGVAFTNAHCTVPVCSPSRNSFFTGVFPHDSRDFGWTPHFNQAVLKHHKTFIELFKENGYATYGTGKLLHINVKDYWDDWGVQENYNYGPQIANSEKLVGHPAVPEPFKSINIVDGSFAPMYNVDSLNAIAGTDDLRWVYSWKKDPFTYENDSVRSLMPDELHVTWIEEKLNDLSQSKEDKPFLMAVGFVKPHTPLYAPQKYFDMFPLEDIQLPEILENDLEDTGYKSVYPPTEMGLHYYSMLKESYPRDEGLRQFLQAYLACTAFVDEQIGKVLDALENSRFAQNTTVILTTDHGWQMGEKNYLYKNSLWDESTRVPFIIKQPGKEPRVIEHAISLIDLFPSVVDLFELEGTHAKGDSAVNIGGHSLRPFLEGENDKWEGPNGALTVAGAGINKPIPGVGEISNPAAPWHIKILTDLDTSYVTQQNYSYRTENFRYILYRNGKEELYDHTSDPNEWNNIANDEAFTDIKVGLKNKMLKIIKEN